MIAGEISVFPLTPIRPVFRHPCHSVPDFANKQQTIIHLLREMLEQQLPILVRVIELVELALRVTSPPSHDKDVVGNNRPEKNNRDGMLSITSRSHAHRATLVLPLVQRHEVVRVAVRLPAGVGRHMVRLSRKAPSPRQAIRPRLWLRLTLPPSAHHSLQRRQTHLSLCGVDRDIEGLQRHAAQNKPVLLCLTPPPRTHAPAGGPDARSRHCRSARTDCVSPATTTLTSRGRHGGTPTAPETGGCAAGSR